MHKSVVAAAVLCGSIVGAPASATLIDFNSYTPLNTCGTFSTGGLTFSTNTGTCVADWNPNPISTNGTPALIYGYGDLEITRTGGGLFEITTFSAGISWYSVQTFYPIHVLATFADNTTISGTFHIGLGFGTSNASGPLLKKLAFTGLPDGYVAIDDITVNFGAVPEPTSWAMLIAGFGIVGATMRMRRQTSLTLDC